MLPLSSHLLFLLCTSVCLFFFLEHLFHLFISGCCRSLPSLPFILPSSPPASFSISFSYLFSSDSFALATSSLHCNLQSIKQCCKVLFSWCCSWISYTFLGYLLSLLNAPFLYVCLWNLDFLNNVNRQSIFWQFQLFIGITCQISQL